MKGIIGLWSGAVIDIPTGWQLCDGTNGTPDLRNNFVIGAGDTYAVDAVGGSATHDHDFTGDGHTHDHVEGPDLDVGVGFDLTTASSVATGTTDADSSLPPFYALAFIQKM